MLQRSEKYFYAPYRQGKGGIDSKICDLELIISTALSMKRIPIIKEGLFPVMHDGRITDIPINWERYIDLLRTRILKAESGRIKELPDTLRYIYERDFGFNSYPKDRIRYINSYQLYDEENEQYPMVCLSESEDMEKLRGIRSKPCRDLHCMDKIRVDNSSSFLVIFSFSQEVNDLTDVVLKYFGTKREGMKLLSGILLPSFRVRNMGSRNLEGILNYYACMSVRYKGDIGVAPRPINKYTTRLKVKEVVKKVRSVIGNKPLYIMSNTMRADCFNFLKPEHNVYKYTDFRELKERFTQGKVPNYNLLYLVENNIMRYALVKILPSEMNSFIFEGPWHEQYGIVSLEQKIGNKIRPYIKRFYK